MTEQDIASITWKFECTYIKDSKKKLEQKLEYYNALTTAPLRYIEHCYKHGTALGQTYKLKSVKSGKAA